MPNGRWADECLCWCNTLFVRQKTKPTHERTHESNLLSGLQVKTVRCVCPSKTRDLYVAVCVCCVCFVSLGCRSKSICKYNIDKTVLARIRDKCPAWFHFFRILQPINSPLIWQTYESIVCMCAIFSRGNRSSSSCLKHIICILNASRYIPSTSHTHNTHSRNGSIFIMHQLSCSKFSNIKNFNWICNRVCSTRWPVYYDSFAQFFCDWCRICVDKYI